MSFSKLTMNRNSNGFVFTSTDNVTNTKIEIRFFNITPNKENVNSFIVIKINGTTIHFSKINLINVQQRQVLSRSLFELYENFDWSKALQACSVKILETILSREEARKIDVTKQKELQWVIRDFIIKQNSTLIFARGGSGKSLTATLIGQCIQNGLQLFGETERMNVLYLDWETDEEEIAYKVKRINSYFEIDDTFYYMRMVLPLATELEYITNEIIGKNIKFVIIDSATPAVGGDIKDAVATTNFFSAVRQLNKIGITTLILSHVSKQHIKEDFDLESQSTPIGSIFFENFPRATYELFGTLNNSFTNQKRIFLIPRKSNIGKLNLHALDVDFKEDKIKFTKITNAFEVLQNTLTELSEETNVISLE